MSIQNKFQKILTDHAYAPASCTFSIATRSIEWEVTESDKALNDNNLQQFPIQAGNATQPLKRNSLPFSTMHSTLTVEINPVHPTQKGNSSPPLNRDSSPSFTPINDSQETRAIQSKKTQPKWKHHTTIDSGPYPKLNPTT